MRRLADPSIQHRRVAPPAEIGKHWPELPVARKRAVLATLIERIDVRLDRIDIRLRPARLATLLDGPYTPPQGANAEETELLSLPARLRRSGREIRMVIDGTDPFATAKPNARLLKLLLRARRFNAALTQGEGIAFAASPSGKVLAGPTSPASSASAISRRTSPRRSSMGGSRAM